MKINAFSRILTFVAFAGGVVCLFAGCAITAGYKQADRTGAGIADYRDEVVAVKQAVDQTLRSIDQIELTANTDPRKAFEKFSKDLAVLNSEAAKAERRGQEMREKGDAYFANWEQQLAELKNPQIRALAQQRRDKLWNAFNNIKSVAEPLKAQFDPWLSDVKDLQTYLNNDLTIEGVDAAKSQIAKTRSDGQQVVKSMDALIAELNSIAAAVTPAKVEDK